MIPVCDTKYMCSLSTSLSLWGFLVGREGAQALT